MQSTFWHRELSRTSSLSSLSQSLLLLLLILLLCTSQVYVTFISGFEDEYSRYDNYRSLVVPNLYACNNSSLPFIIGNMRVGIIQSDGFETEAFYPPNTSCTWILFVSKDDIINVVLHQRHFDLLGAKLELFEDNSDEPVRTYTKRYPSARTYKSTSNRLRIKFTSGPKAASRGFRIYFMATKRPINCTSEFSIPCRNRIQCYTDEIDECDGKMQCIDGTDEENCPKGETMPMISRPNILDSTNAKIVSPTILSSFEMCGRPAIKPLVLPSRIVGGERARPGSWPWVASIRYEGFKPLGRVCSGVLINRQWLLTALHCFANRNSHFVLSDNLLRSGFEIYLGRFNSIVSYDDHEIIRYVGKLFVPPHFYVNNNSVDIALVKLNAPVPLDNSFISPICLPNSPNENYYGQNLSAYVVGWGDVDSPLYLQQVNLPIIDLDECKRMYKNSNTIDQYTICAGRTNYDACKGDSGGPLMLYDKTNNRWKLIGIVSSGSSICGSKDNPGIYSRVDILLDWIKETIDKN